MRSNGVEHYKILLIKEYTDISKDRLQKREHKYIKRYDSVKNGLNTYEMGGYYCIHNMMKRYCMSCNGSSMCAHGRITRLCAKCTPYTCDRCNNAYEGKQGLIQHQKRCNVLIPLTE